MGFMKNFFGRGPEDYERRGDNSFESGEYGEAKLEYDAGLHKLGKTDPGNTELRSRIEAKILKSKEALALDHKQKGDEIMESQYYEEAEEFFRLALELTEDPELRTELRERLKEIKGYCSGGTTAVSGDVVSGTDKIEGEGYGGGDDEYFEALCGAFSDKEREKAYKHYGESFRAGYLALNRGDFELAVDQLSKSMDENSGSETYIPLELATAYLNLGMVEEAGRLLASFLEGFPYAVEGYQMLCETLWAAGAFDNALELLQNCPEEITASPGIQLLKGETFFQAGEFEEAKAFFLDYLKSFGLDENIAVSLAHTYEALNEKEKARDLYRELMDQCSGCGIRIPSFIKRKYGDISLECGQYSVKILELYLSLTREDPDNKLYYYQKISEIYSEMGNEEEALRFRSFKE